MSNNNSVEHFDYLQRVISERLYDSNAIQVQSKMNDKFELTRYEVAQTREELAKAQQELKSARQEVQNAEIARQEALEQTHTLQRALQHDHTRVEFLERELTNVLLRPLVPLKDALSRRLAIWLRKPVGMISERHEHKLRKSAAKRNPRRYLSATESDSRSLDSYTATQTHPSRDYEEQTRAIIDRFNPDDSSHPPFYFKIGATEIVRDRLRSAALEINNTAQTDTAFSILTPYYAHETYFIACAQSVEDARLQTSASIEWIIFNDDPAMSDERLLSLVPANLQPMVRIVSDGMNHGIAVGQNRAAAAASNPWLVLLDCDDMLEPHALEKLRQAIAGEPTTRYFSSLMIDIDENGAEFRRRQRINSADELFKKGMIAGHMVAIRQDLFAQLNGFDERFSGVQDYDFVLRVAAQEKIGLIEEHLYRYRWHDKTQSVSKTAQQKRLADMVRLSFLTETLNIRRFGQLSCSKLPKIPHALCVIRTQGSRMELLAETLASIRAQALPMTPCIVVHGDDSCYAFVKRYLAAEITPDHPLPAVFLQAPDKSRRRGYPCNVALNYLAAHSDRYDLLCFLDDDDHYLPGFSDRLVNLMRTTNADMAYGLTNALPIAGEPITQHKLMPFAALVGGNFIPFNSFLVRTEAVIAAKARFDEDMHYLEDYDFLLQLLIAGIKAEALPEAISEYRLLGDGNLDTKKDPEDFTRCMNRAKMRLQNAVREKNPVLSEENFVASSIEFPAFLTDEWDEVQKAHMLHARSVLTALRCGK